MTGAGTHPTPVPPELEALIGWCPVPMIAIDGETSAIVAANPAVAELYGWSVEELTSMSIADLRPAEERSLVVDPLRRPSRSDTPATLGEPTAGSGTVRHAAKDGGVLQVGVVWWEVDLGGGRGGRLVLLHDDTDRVRQQLDRDLAVHRLFGIQERLHDAIAERLHDGPVQTLTAASLRIGLMRRSADPSAEPALAEIERLVLDALHSVRREMDDQRSPLDVASDLAGALRSLLVRFGLQEHYLVRAAGAEPPATVAALLHRIAMSVLSDSPLGSDVDDPWVVDVTVGDRVATARIPVAPTCELERRLADWMGAMGGTVVLEQHDGSAELHLSLPVPEGDATTLIGG